MTINELSESFNISLKALYSIKPKSNKPVFIDIYRNSITNKVERFTFKIDFSRGVAEYV